MAERISVGVRALRNNFSHFLAEVREGAEIVITSHGKTIAELKAPTKPAVHPQRRVGGLKGKGWILADDWDQWDAETQAVFNALYDPDTP